MKKSRVQNCYKLAFPGLKSLGYPRAPNSSETVGWPLSFLSNDFLSIWRGVLQIPVDIDEDHLAEMGISHEQQQPTETIGDEQGEPEFRGGPDRSHLSWKVVRKHGPRERCAGCRAIAGRGCLPERLVQNRSDECRCRIMMEMEVDPQYKRFIRINMAKTLTTLK